MKHLFSMLFLALCLPMLCWAQEHSTAAPEITNRPANEQSLRQMPDGYYFSLQIIEVKVHHDRTMDVKERMRANFIEESHGIFRAIPKFFWVKRDVSEAQDGSDFQMRYNSLDVEDLDVSEEFQERDNDSIFMVRIGSADVTLKGYHTYEINYRLNMPNDDRVDAGDLFFHSIIGSGWNCPTDTVFFTVEFDDEIPAASLDSLKVICGPEGTETNSADQVLMRKEGHILRGYYFGLKEHEAISIYMPLPQGFFAKGEIPFWRTLAWIFAAITLMLALYLLFLEIKGDEPVTPVVTFRPSKGLTSADIGSLVDAKVDDIDLLSIIPWLAAEGHIVMTQTNKGKTTITKGDKELPADTPEYIRCLYDGLFLKKKEFFIDSPGYAFSQKWNKSHRLLKAKYAVGLVDQFSAKPMILMAFCFCLTCIFAQVAPDSISNASVLAFLMLLEYLFFWKWKTLTRRIRFNDGCQSGCLSLLIINALVIAITTGTGSFLLGTVIKDDYYLPKAILLSLGALVAVVIMFNLRLRRLTPLRRKHLGEILGLKEFILTAEKDRLEMLLREDERYFYRILPYAMVFGLVDKWAAKFDALTVMPVREFSNTSISSMSSLLNSQDMKNFAYKTRSATPPGSSISGGGGSGGGGGWGSFSSSGGSYSSSSSHRGGYAGGGSGGGGGGRW